MLKTANPILKNQKGIATCSTSEVNLPPRTTDTQFTTRVPSPQPRSSQDWPLHPLWFKENFPLRQLSMEGKFLS